ncbi:MAG: winged helix-turn-helix transcriptional regulator [Dehalococcoidales bacterium]|nr:winged helix-turn-helix transcriptional regulator [Dehalococcoidales bacterium]
MTQVLRNKNLATKFQILLEIAANQPSIQQKDIALKIGVTSQAVSDYISKLEKDDWITSDGRSRYRITKEGVNWMLKSLRELQQYSNSAERVLTNITTWSAIAALDLKKGQRVGLVMKAGLLYASAYHGKGASGITTGNADKGEDAGITDIEGIVELDIGQITVLEVPDIQRGGSKSSNLNKMKKTLAEGSLIGAIGIEAIVALRKIDIEPDYLYGVTHAAIEAVRSGLSFVIVCSSSESPALLQRLNAEHIKYTLIDTHNKR